MHIRKFDKFCQARKWGTEKVLFSCSKIC